jgi:plasmid stabilization system protein ParE
MRIRWTPAAAADLQRISNYLKDHHPHYRLATIRKVYAALQSLKEWPQLRLSQTTSRGTFPK